MSSDPGYKICHIAKTLDLTRHAVARIISQILKGEPFYSYTDKKAETIRVKHATMSRTKFLLHNIVTSNNSII